MEAFISTYGYAAVLVGAFFEGETVVLLAGFAAHLGYLELPWVVVSAVAGGTAGDQAYFYLGRIKGTELLRRHPRWGDKARRVLELIGNNENLVMVAFRFLYGLRMITPVMLALSGVRPVKFLAFDVGGTVVWAIIFASIGYVSGQALEIVLGEIKRIEIVLLVALVVFATVAGLAHWWLRRRRDHS